MRSTSSASEEQRAFSEETLRVMKEHAAASDDLLPVFEAWIAADGNVGRKCEWDLCFLIAPS